MKKLVTVCLVFAGFGVLSANTFAGAKSSREVVLKRRAEVMTLSLTRTNFTVERELGVTLTHSKIDKLALVESEAKTFPVVDKRLNATILDWYLSSVLEDGVAKIDAGILITETLKVDNSVVIPGTDVYCSITPTSQISVTLPNIGGVGYPFVFIGTHSGQTEYVERSSQKTNPVNHYLCKVGAKQI